MGAMMQVPGFVDAFDLWAAHCYAHNHPPSYNIHDGTAFYLEVTIDCYLRQKEVLSAYGRGDVQFFIKETGYDPVSFQWIGPAALLVNLLVGTVVSLMTRNGKPASGEPTSGD